MEYTKFVRNSGFRADQFGEQVRRIDSVVNTLAIAAVICGLARLAYWVVV